MLTMEKGEKRKKEIEQNIRPENPKSWIFDKSPYLQHLSLSHLGVYNPRRKSELINNHKKHEPHFVFRGFRAFSGL